MRRRCGSRRAENAAEAIPPNRDGRYAASVGPGRTFPGLSAGDRGGAICSQGTPHSAHPGAFAWKRLSVESVFSTDFLLHRTK